MTVAEEADTGPAAAEPTVGAREVAATAIPTTRIHFM
jgi:hypothetical protein